MATKTATTATPSITVCNWKLDPGQYSWSPFVTKLEARMRFAGLKYKVEAGTISEAPRSKIPFVKISDPEEPGKTDMLGDSTLITKHFVERGLLPDLNGELSGAQRVQDVALRALLEDKLYFFLVHERWLINENFYIIRDEGPLSHIPYPIRIFVGFMVHRKISRTLTGLGTAKYSTEEADDIRNEVWGALNEMVSTSQAKRRPKGQIAWVLGGSDPTEVDASLFGFLSASLISHGNPRLVSALRGYPALVKYASEVHDQYFPDYAKWKD